MTVVWAATSPSSGRLGPQRESDASELFARIAELRVSGSGYVEAGRANQKVPYLSLAFNRDQAVIERINQDGSMSILFGDGSTPSTADVWVPLMDDPDPALFSGDFSSDVERALGVLSAFLNGSDPDALGSWFDL